MSILGKKWQIKNTNPLKSTFEKILENRDLNLANEISDFHDPFLFRGMNLAVARIKTAIDNREKIIVFGDYDVDGISGAAIVIKILQKLNANVSYRLPNRLTDGYGLSEKFIDEFIAKKIDLVITVDCGISCINEIKKAHDNGIDVIVTDHHAIPKNPPEDVIAILHPKFSGYPFPDLTGAGVAFKLAHALIIKNFPKENHEEFLNDLVDLASLGTVADLGSLKDENRLIVKRGLETLAKTKWVGLKKIISLAEIGHDRELDCGTIGYRIAPRINAAGRIGDPYIALSLLLQDEEGEKVDFLGQKLEGLNKERQGMTLKAFDEMQLKIIEGESLPYILISESADWHVGILGLVAGKLVESYGRPAVIMQDFGDSLVGSARSPEYFNIIEAITAQGAKLINFGGHAQAAGFNIKKENLENFKKELEIYAEEKLKNIDLKPTLEIDCEPDLDELNFELANKIDRMKPFGVGNSRPVFVLHGLEPYYVDQVGKEKEHLKFSVNIKNQSLPVIAFRLGRFAEKLRQQQKIDLAFHLEKNIWNGREIIQLHALDLECGD